MAHFSSKLASATMLVVAIGIVTSGCENEVMIQGTCHFQCVWTRDSNHYDSTRCVEGVYVEATEFEAREAARTACYELGRQYCIDWSDRDGETHYWIGLSEVNEDCLSCGRCDASWEVEGTAGLYDSCEDEECQDGLECVTDTFTGTGRAFCSRECEYRVCQGSCSGMSGADASGECVAGVCGSHTNTEHGSPDCASGCCYFNSVSRVGSSSSCEDDGDVMNVSGYCIPGL